MYLFWFLRVLIETNITSDRLMKYVNELEDRAIKALDIRLFIDWEY